MAATIEAAEVAGAEVDRADRTTLQRAIGEGVTGGPLPHPTLVASAGMDAMDETTGPMHTTGPFRALGASVTIETHDPALTEALTTLCAPTATPDGTDAPMDDRTAVRKVARTATQLTSGEQTEATVERSSVDAGVAR